ncbi:MAG: heavy-metal-associated domain-containing protein [Nitrospina sp.]|mgnify:CR=1 FL=1|jgi:copper chaperone CopZ|nr:heavy-metal-associated domain-containing protein [Nitrospina sp.]MBT6718877.1 heavy-metal-associated domain-containing protein [Nitrospina sp.]
MKKNLIVALLCLLLIYFSGADVSAKDATQKVMIKVEGLYCPFCSYGLEKQVKKIEGFKSVQINIKEGTAEIEFKSGVEISEKAILTAVEDAGFDLDGVKWLTGKKAQ